MTPLVIGLAAVVMVILIAVVIGMRYVRNEERADLADREEDGGRTEEGARQDQGQADSGMAPGRTAAGAAAAARPRAGARRGSGAPASAMSVLAAARIAAMPPRTTVRMTGGMTWPAARPRAWWP